jgi:hypothetical protein
LSQLSPDLSWQNVTSLTGKNALITGIACAAAFQFSRAQGGEADFSELDLSDGASAAGGSGLQDHLPGDAAQVLSVSGGPIIRTRESSTGCPRRSTSTARSCCLSRVRGNPVEEFACARS